MALTAKFDKAVYTPGDTMTLTVTTTAEERDRFTDTPFTVHVSVVGVGDADVTAALHKQVADAAVVVTDPDRTWAQVSDDGVKAVFTTKA